MSDVVRLQLEGMGHVPSFKNKKRVAGKRVFTEKETRLWMEEAILSLQSQLRSAIRTNEPGTPTVHCPPCLTALSGHSTDFDDSHQWIPEIHVLCREVPAGEEGAAIEIRISVESTTNTKPKEDAT